MRAVDDLTLRHRPGKVVGFLGPNGSGKTTTLRLARSAWSRPTTGTATIDGLPYAELRRPAHAGRRHARGGASTPAARRATTCGCSRPRAASRLRASTRCSSSSSSAAPRAGAPAASRSACASGSASPPRCSATPASSSSTSPPTASTPRASAGCATSCAAWPPRAAPCCSPATCSRRSPRPSTTSWSSPTAGSIAHSTLDALGTGAGPRVRVRLAAARRARRRARRVGLRRRATTAPATLLVAGASAGADRAARVRRTASCCTRSPPSRSNLEDVFFDLTSTPQMEVAA